jgi:hypothetical protein
LFWGRHLRIECVAAEDDGDMQWEIARLPAALEDDWWALADPGMSQRKIIDDRHLIRDHTKDGCPCPAEFIIRLDTVKLEIRPQHRSAPLLSCPPGVLRRDSFRRHDVHEIEDLLSPCREPKLIVYPECLERPAPELMDSRSGNRIGSPTSLDPVDTPMDEVRISLPDGFATIDGRDIRRHVDRWLNDRIDGSR